MTAGRTICSLNVVNFANPDGQLRSGNFGKITNAGPALILQIAVKDNF